MSTVQSRVAFPALGTTAVLIVDDARAAAPARQAVEASIAAVDLACSRFREDSELARLNRAAGRTVAVSTLLIEALGVALRAAHVTDGLVDPTVGGAMRVLGYDRDFARIDRSGPPLIVRVRSVPGWRNVAIDHSAGTVRIPAGVELDLGATAKALCADRAAAAAAAATGAGVLVSLGGDIATAGPAPAGGWSVRVTDDHASAVDEPDVAGQTVAIVGGGLATSSTTVRRWARGATQIHHLVDPGTGLPADTVWRTVSVAAGTCVDANTASTAAVILGAGAVSWLSSRGLPARLVAVDGSATVVGGWPSC